jgi:uncharacterized membrane protein YhaH (DUF805 family)
MYLYLCSPLKKSGQFLKIFIEISLIFLSFLFTKSADKDNKFGRNKKASTFALPIKRVAIKRLKDL